MNHARKPRKLWVRAATAMLPVAIALLAWAAVGFYVREVRATSAPFPGPIATAQRLVELLGGKPMLQHSIYAHIGASLSRWLLGFLAGAAGAVVAATICGWSSALERALMPLVYVLQLIPGLAWIPIAILLFGIGNSATVFMIVVTAFAPVAVNMVAGMKSTSEEHLRVARMAGARPRDVFFRVLLPSSVPHLMSGLRVGLGNSWRVVVAAEMVVGTGSGLGYSIIQSRWTLDYTSAFVCIAFICLTGLAVEYLAFSKLEAMTTRRWGLVRD